MSLLTKAAKLRAKREAARLFSAIYETEESTNVASSCERICLDVCELTKECNNVPVIVDANAPDEVDVAILDVCIDVPDETDGDFDNIYTSSDESSDSDSPETFAEQLRRWAIKNNIANNVLNELLVILRNNNMNVPKDSRTLKKTPKEVVARNMGDGFYIHYGLSDALTDFLMVNDYESEIINMDVNVDGLPLCKSSSKNVWPNYVMFLVIQK